MQAKEVFRVLGNFLLLFGVLLLVPLFISIYYDYISNPLFNPQPHASLSFVWSILISLFSGIFFRFVLGYNSSKILYRKASLLVVVLIWFVASLVGALPFLFSKTLSNPVNAYFEAMSALTTTGATTIHPKNYDPKTNREIPYKIKLNSNSAIEYTFYGTISPIYNQHTKKWITGIEAVNKGILFWRSFMQWIGGMGIVLLLIAIFPAIGVGGKLLYQTETTGVSKDSITPRIREMASLLWKIYLSLTVLESVLLIIFKTNMTFFESITTTFSTISTGGFSVRNNSITSFNSTSAEWIVMLFMIIGSVNFSLYVYAIRGKIFRFYNTEFICYLIFLILCCGYTAYAIYQKGHFSIIDSIRYGSFQIISAQTSTGFTAINHPWPVIVEIISLIVMYIGSMAGSTGGGIKIIRFIVLFSSLKYVIKKIFYPNQVNKLYIEKKEVNLTVALTTLAFFFAVVIISAIATLLFIFDGTDPASSVAITACMINNIGISFLSTGPTTTFAFLDDFSKIISIFLMVLGRLEYFPVLIMFLPSFWKRT